MALHKKTITFVTLVSLTVMITAATITPKPVFKNLKVLPKDITEKQLDSLMDTYCRALKVDCEFCHVPPKDLMGLPLKNAQNDFSTDNEMKETARHMISMTMDINKNNFKYDSLVKPAFMNVVSCNTCHRGNPFPAHE